MPATRFFSVALALLFALSAAAPSPTRALTDYGFTYTQSGGFATVTGCDGACPSPLNIPAVLGGFFVTSIGEGAFAMQAVTGLSIPTTVQNIGNAAFYSNSITSVTIPSSVTNIGIAAFEANSITTVTIASSVVSIGPQAFFGNQLTDVVIPNSVLSIGSLAFGENSLTSIDLGSSVTSIGSFAFAENALTSITIPSSVNEIESSAFELNSLTSVSFQGNAPSFGLGVFYGNSGLISVTRSHLASGWGSTWSGEPVVIRDVRAAATVKPTVRGTAVVGNTLTAVRGTWTGYPTPTYTYQWYACSGAVSAARSTVPTTCKRIVGATRSTFRPTSAQRGKYVAVLVKGTSLRTSATVWLSKSTARVK